MAILRSSCDTRNQSGCSRSKLQMRAASLASGSCLVWFMEKAETGLRVSPVLFMQVSSNVCHLPWGLLVVPVNSIQACFLARPAGPALPALSRRRTDFQACFCTALPRWCCLSRLGSHEDC